MKKFVSFFVALLLCVVVSKAHGLTYGLTVTAPGNNPGETNKASATFVVVNMNLVVTLSNIATYDPNDAQDILTGVFLNIAGDPKLTPISAELGPDSSVVGHSLPLGFSGDVGGEWAYRNDLTKAPGGLNEGIAAANLKQFGNKKYLFPGDNLEGGKAPGGIDFGLTTLADLPNNDRGSIKNKGLIQNTIVFTFSGLPADFGLSDITDVTFQYG